jgi:hypothetical protein
MAIMIISIVIIIIKRLSDERAYIPAEMAHGLVTTIIAIAVIRKLPGHTLALTLLAKIKRVGVCARLQHMQQSYKARTRVSTYQPVEIESANTAPQHDSAAVCLIGSTLPRL